MDTFISQQPKAIESRHRCQMITMTVFYNLVIRFTNKLTFLLLIYLRNLRYKRKMTGKGRGYTNKIANISVTKSSREKKLVSNDCYDNILYPGYKIYKQADFLVVQIIENIRYWRKITAKGRRYTN